MALLSPYAGLLGEDANRFAQAQGLLGMGASLLSAGGPSPVPMGLGQAVGQGLQGGLSGYLNAAQMGLQADQIQRDRERGDWMRDLQERQYGLQEAGLDLRQQEAERQRSMYDQLFGAGGPGFDNPYAAAAAMSGDWGPAATAYANTPGTYGGAPTAATAPPIPAAEPGAVSLIPPGINAAGDVAATAPVREDVAHGIAGAAVAMMPPAMRGQYESVLGMPGGDGGTYEEWAQTATAMARDLAGMDWAQTDQFREQLDNEWARLNGGLAVSNAPPQAQPQQGIPEGAAFDRQTGEYHAVRGPDGSDWYAALDESGALVPLAPMPQSPAFSGTGLEAEYQAIIARGDPSSSEYAQAYFELYQRPRYVQTPDGTVEVQPALPDPSAVRPPANPVVPITGSRASAPIAGTERITEGQRGAAGFANRLAAADETMRRVEGMEEFNDLLWAGEALSYVPLDALGNAATPPALQQYEQAQRDFINAVLREESGAAISSDEFENARRQYFPQPGDSEAVIRQKQEARRRALDNMIAASGEGYRLLFEESATPTVVDQYGLEPR